MEAKKVQVAVIGSGFGGLTAAALLAKQGLQVAVLEQNKYPGGCASSYKRKGYWFETGATTMVGLDEGMPLRYLLDETGIQVSVLPLEIPMQVRLEDGTLITRYPELEAWILEAERVFGSHGQRSFWETCYQISKAVWQTSLQQLSFPFSSADDLWQALKHVRLSQLKLPWLAFRTMQDLLKEHGLLEHEQFIRFVDQQLLITAQNTHEEVNALFGATALCYTLYGNYYVHGGLRQLAEPVVHYLIEHGGQMWYGHLVNEVTPSQEGYLIDTSKGMVQAEYIVFGIPLNNVHQLFRHARTQAKLSSYLLSSQELNSAFTWAVAFKTDVSHQILHHQLHVPGKIPLLGSESIFLSLNHPDDHIKGPAGVCVASVSTHVRNPAENWITHKKELEDWLISFLTQQGFFTADQVLYVQSATPGAWIDWTGREWGQVGGYPQYKRIKPWQMKDARLDHHKAYVCGDTVYPGQGIPGVCLSGIIAAKKMLLDHF